MPEQKFDLYIDNEIAAENMEIDIMLLLVKSLFETYYGNAEAGMEIMVKVREKAPVVK